MTNTNEVVQEVVLDDDPPVSDLSEIGRRSFIKRITGIGAAGLGAATAGAASIVATFISARPAMAAPKSYLVLDPALCTGCRTCMVACSTYNNGGEASLELARLTVPRHPFHSTWESMKPVNYQPRPCLQCTDAPCVNACPVGAIQTDHKSGTNARVIDENACIGCKACIEACESVYEIPRIQFDPARKKATKCHLCAGNPQCVSWCPNHAISFVSAEEFAPRTKNANGQVVNVEQDYRIVRSEDRIAELGYPQQPKAGIVSHSVSR